MYKLGQCSSKIALSVAALLWCCGQVLAFDAVQFDVAGPNSKLKDDLRAASLVVTAFEEKRTEPTDVLSAALADYSRLLETLYANGYYSSQINISVDGREAASLQLLAAPSRIRTVAIRVDPGPEFRFSSAVITPLAPGAEQIDEFQPGQPARSTVVRDAVEGAVDDWRDAGHAKAAPAGQNITADHNKNTLATEVQLDQGPRVRFGNLIISTPSAVREERIKRIAGLPSGTVFSPETLSQMATRLRRTGAFSSISISEAAQLDPANNMDIGLALVDEKPRRFGFGAEISSLEGLNLTGFWLHRNLMGGAERLRLGAAVGNIGAQSGGIDYSLNARLSIPAIVATDTELFFLGELAHLEEPGYTSDQASLGAGVKWFASDNIEAEAGVTYIYSDTEDDLGQREFSLLTFPASVTWDRRDDPLNTTHGFYANLQATPFLGFDGSASGARAYADGRVYRSLGAEDGIVLAARLQFGSIVGADHTDVHPDFLFYSGGGGTVRGQPYQSLGVDLGGGVEIGGRSFIGTSIEARAAITDSIGAVAFFDAGYIGPESFSDGSGEWHSGAGLGLRYNTGIGPIRFDVAAPVSGDTGDGVQVYLGIGQAF